MYTGLLIILVPLMVGYLLPWHQPALLQRVNRLLSLLIYAILFFMGTSLAFLDNLGTNLLIVFKTALIATSAILSCSLLALWLLDRRWPWRQQHRQQNLPSRWHMVLEPLKLCVAVLASFLLELTQWAPLRQITLNQRGMTVALVSLCGSLGGGVLAAWLFGVSLSTGLALTSVFGWYSLSGILMTEAYGPVIDSAAFFKRSAARAGRSAADSGAGQPLPQYSTEASVATSMDFTLPILQRAGGMEIVPAVIVHGFIMNLLALILIALFFA